MLEGGGAAGEHVGTGRGRIFILVEVAAEYF
jgi:hypothetical protein